MPAGVPTRTYTDDERATALARIAAGESQHQVAAALGIPLSTVNMWHLRAEEAAGRLDTKKERPEWTAAYITASHMAAGIIQDNLERYQGRELSPRDLQSVAIVGGIATERALDLRDGRKGTQINVDARSLTLPPGLTVDELRALAAPDNNVK